MPETSRNAIAVVGVDIGKNSFHVIGAARSLALNLLRIFDTSQSKVSRTARNFHFVGMASAQAHASQLVSS